MPAPAGEVAAARDVIKDSVVRVYASVRSPDTQRPWTRQAVSEVTGSGVIIDGHRILTNAHVVAYASQVQVQANESGDKVSATVVAFAPDVDMALLKLDDESFFATRAPLPRESRLPQIKDEVLAYGFPTGGSTLSITKGIVSRVDFAAYSRMGGGLRVQTDAAINPGNSGGPVVANGKMTGLAFASLVGTQNISYVIPTEEVELFLRSAANGTYVGKPAIREDLQSLENPQLRAWLKLGADVKGLVVRRPYEGLGPSPLKEWDVITHIGETPIDDQGMVNVGGQRVRFTYLVQKVVRDDRVPLRVVRAGKPLEVQLPVSARLPLLLADLQGTYPPYFIYGPLSFSRGSGQLMQALGPVRVAQLAAMGNSVATHFMDAPDANRDEFVVVTAPLFSHRLSVGYANPSGFVVESVNGTRIRSLTHLVTVLRDLKDEFVVFRFDQRYGENLVFRRQDVVAATADVLADNSIRAQGSPELLAIWQGAAPK